MEKCAAWKGGRKISNYGYVLIYLPDHPNARPDGYIFEHRLVMSNYLGRPLRDDEIVHHKDGNKLNNDISNLEITTRSAHTALHNQEKEIIRSKDGRIVTVIPKFPQATFEVVDELSDTERGAGGFGSSGVHAEVGE